jgi:hypothetical protein
MKIMSNRMQRPRCHFTRIEKYAPINIGGYFPAASNSFTFPITAKASAT